MPRMQTGKPSSLCVGLFGDQMVVGNDSGLLDFSVVQVVCWPQWLMNMENKRCACFLAPLIGASGCSIKALNQAPCYDSVNGCAYVTHDKGRLHFSGLAVADCTESDWQSCITIMQYSRLS